MFVSLSREANLERAGAGRYLAMARLSAVMVSGVVVLFGIEPSTGPLPQYLTLTVIVAYNLAVGAVALRLWTTGGAGLLVLTVADLAISSAIVGVTGAYDSPYFALFLYAAAEAALYFEWKPGIAAILLMNGVQVLIAVTRVAPWRGAVSFPALERRSLLFVIVGLIFVVLGETMRREERARRSAERASLRVVKLNQVYDQLGRAHLRLEGVFSAVFSAAESVNGIRFSAILHRSGPAAEWRVAATSRSEECPVGTAMSSTVVNDGTEDRAEGVRIIEGPVVGALFPCMSGGRCRQLVLYTMPAFPQTEEGLLAIGRQDCRPLDEDDQTFLAALAMQAQLAIHNALLYRRRSEAFERLASFNQMQDTFFAAAAHEFKTPLTVLGVLTSTLEMTLPSPTPQQAEMFAAIEQNIRRLRMHTENMLAVARLEVGGVALHRRVVDPKQVVRQALDTLEAPLRDRDITTVLEPEVDWAGVYADSARLGEVFQNLLSNAAKFAPAHSRITVRFERTEGESRFAVCNLGPSVTEEERERIFEKAYTGTTAGARAGTGLGLYVARQLVLLHGGRMWVESAAGSTCFCIALPNEEGRSSL